VAVSDPEPHRARRLDLHLPLLRLAGDPDHDRLDDGRDRGLLRLAKVNHLWPFGPKEIHEEFRATPATNGTASAVEPVAR
jgi:hypothetical protein